MPALMKSGFPGPPLGITADTPALTNVFFGRSFRNFAVHLSHSENLESVSFAKPGECAPKRADEDDLIEKSHGPKAVNFKIFMYARRRDAKT